jgi:hypothetical protein
LIWCSECRGVIRISCLELAHRIRAAEGRDFDRSRFPFDGCERHSTVGPISNFGSDSIFSKHTGLISSPSSVKVLVSSSFFGGPFRARTEDPLIKSDSAQF